MTAARTTRLLRRRPLAVELGVLVVLYAVYELTRGLVVGGAATALAHAADVAALERALGIAAERALQEASMGVPGAVAFLGLAYVSLHLAGTGVTLLWLHRRRPDAYEVARTAIVLASFVSVLGYALYPTAPPRLADGGLVDTVQQVNGVDLGSPLVSAFYNPYAAIPSMHFGYALVLAVVVGSLCRTSLGRALWLAYPPFVLLAIVATGNHYLLDAVAGAFVAHLALRAARGLHGVERAAPERQAELPGVA